MSQEISTAAVVGLGTMGAGIAEIIARQGIAVVGVEKDADALEAGRASIERSTQRAVDAGKLEADEREALLGRITFTTDAADAASAQIVVEAVAEDVALKAEVFAALDEVVAADAVLATNTSSLSVTEIGTMTKDPSRVVGLHFFNPAPVQPFVEVVKTVVSSADAVATAVGFAETLGKTTVTVGDRAGFIANSLLFGYLNHAVRMFEEKYASREDIDAAMRFGCGYPMGPLALLDLVGLDTAYEILASMYEQSGDRLHAPAPILKQMVTAGLLGRKSGAGFYSYEGRGSSTVVADGRTPSADDKPSIKHDISKVGVVGTGTMASGIVEVFAKAGYDVVCVGRSDEKAQAVADSLAKSLDKAIAKGRFDETKKDETVARVTPTTSMEDLADVDIVVEAIAEDLAIKTALFENLDRICKDGAILATTTSSLPIAQCAAVTKRPSDVIGMHFFNPAPIMKLVEVVSTVSTGADVTETVTALCSKIGKVPVNCGDRAGFIVNALLFPYLNDAVSMLEAHYATADDIDTAMKQGCRLPMGPFALLDVVGNDVSLAIQKELYAEFREPGFKPAPLLQHLVTAGYLGRKTGKGFRDYSKR